MERSPDQDDLLTVDDVAGYLGVGAVTIYRWCREGRLPCAKLGKSWRIRRGALASFLAESEEHQTLVRRMGAFITIPDRILAFATTEELMLRLDAAFFKVAEARGGNMMKYLGGQPISLEDTREQLTGLGLSVEQLERDGQLHFTYLPDPSAPDLEGLRRTYIDNVDPTRSLWVSFNWMLPVTPEQARRQHEAMERTFPSQRLVIKTAISVDVANDWTPGQERRAREDYLSTVYLSERGLLLSRMMPLPPD